MPEPQPAEPNIVVLMVDQLAMRWLESPMADAVPTPNIDRLREEGVCFDRAFADNPLCAPARATISTGLTARGHGVIQNGYRLNPDLPTYMGLLQNAGWQTGLAGKLHHVPHFEDVDPDASVYGFDETHITEDGRVGPWLDWVRETAPEHYEAALAMVWSTDLPAIRNYGPEEEDLRPAIEAAHERYHGDLADEAFLPQPFTLPLPSEYSQTEWITGHGLEFIDQAPGNGPFLSQISYVQPHHPAMPPESCLDRVDVEAIPEPAPIEWIDDPNAPDFLASNPEAVTTIPDDWQRLRHYYLADLVHLDDQIGRILDALDEQGIRDETYVLFLSDHGERLLDHGFVGKMAPHYDSCIRVPMMIAGPGLASGTTRSEFVQLVDVFPTILDMAGVEPPTPPSMGPHIREEPTYSPGRSLVPLCRGEAAADWREAVYAESYSGLPFTSPERWCRTIRTDRYRYSIYLDGSSERLFDLQEDPAEQENLVADSDVDGVRSSLRDRLFERVVLQDHPHPPRDLFAHGVH